MALPAIMDWGGRLLTLARRVDRLFEFQARVDASVGVIEERLRVIEDRVLRMEAEAPRAITEARAAASATATAMSGAALNDVVTRLTRVEMRLELLNTYREVRSSTPRIAGPGRSRKRGAGEGENG